MSALPRVPIAAEIIHDYIIDPALKRLATADSRLDNPAARKLLLGTAAHESQGFRHIFQTAGPARSLWQIEPKTGLRSVMEWLDQHAAIKMAVAAMAWKGHSWADQYAWNHALACALARVYYWRIPAALPDTLAGLATYWKQYYNTPAGKGTAAQWLRDYERYCAGAIA